MQMMMDLAYSLPDHTQKVTDVVWSPDGSQLASGSLDTTARLWNIATGTCQVLTSHNKAVTTLAWSSDGTKLASGSLDQVTYIWDTSTGAQQFVLALEQDISSLAWSPDGEKLLILSKGKLATVWKIIPMPDLSSVPLVFESSSTFKLTKNTIHP